MNIACEIVPHGGEEYQALVSLRRRVLRAPLGFDFTPEELAEEAPHLHVAAYVDNEVSQYDAPPHRAVRVAIPPQAGSDNLFVGTLQAIDLGNGKWKIRQVAVTPEAQGEGVGRAMNGFIEGELKRRNATHITLNARESAIPFYERLGYLGKGEMFEEIGLSHRRMVKNL